MLTVVEMLGINPAVRVDLESVAGLLGLRKSGTRSVFSMLQVVSARKLTGSNKQ